MGLSLALKGEDGADESRSCEGMFQAQIEQLARVPEPVFDFILFLQDCRPQVIQK
jgi:hypothetical protein